LMPKQVFERKICSMDNKSISSLYLVQWSIYRLRGGG